MEKHVVSKKRVADHGEVYTLKREVNAMLDLVRQETERIESRFLEPACGTGNFLVEVLERKLRIVKSRYKKSRIEYERYAVLAVSSIYGVDILKDNTEACRQRLFEIFDSEYTSLFGKEAQEKCREAVRFILHRNIIWGDATTLKTAGENPIPIIFSEWSPLNGNMLKRRDFMLSYLLEKKHQLVMFNDENKEACLNEPVKDFPPTHFLSIADV